MIATPTEPLSSWPLSWTAIEHSSSSIRGHEHVGLEVGLFPGERGRAKRVFKFWGWLQWGGSQEKKRKKREEKAEKERERESRVTKKRGEHELKGLEPDGPLMPFSLLFVSSLAHFVFKTKKIEKLERVSSCLIHILGTNYFDVDFLTFYFMHRSSMPI